MRLILFCKNDKKELLWDDLEHKKYQNEMGIEEERYVLNSDKQYSFTKNLLNGKAVLECDYKVEEISEELYGDLDWLHDYLPTTDTCSICTLETKSCLNREDIISRLQDGKGYAIHINNIQVYNSPREKKEYDHIVGKYYPEDLRVVSPLGMEVKYVKQIERKIFSKNITCMQVIEYMALECTPLEMYNILKGKQTILIRKRLNKKFLC